MNESGIKPIEYKVLVLPERVATESDGGIVYTQETVDAEELAQTEGILVDKSNLAFSNGKNSDGSVDRWACDIPTVGQRVKFSKYSGLMVDGVDGNRYRIINDKDVMAILGEQND